jgi:hypothetical protein
MERPRALRTDGTGEVRLDRLGGVQLEGAARAAGRGADAVGGGDPTPRTRGRARRLGYRGQGQATGRIAVSRRFRRPPRTCSPSCSPGTSLVRSRHEACERGRADPGVLRCSRFRPALTAASPMKQSRPEVRAGGTPTGWVSTQRGRWPSGLCARRGARPDAALLTSLSPDLATLRRGSPQSASPSVSLSLPSCLVRR